MFKISSGLIMLISLFMPYLATAFEITGLERPESFLLDEETGYYYISNVNGGPMLKDGNGFIARVAPDGKNLEMQFVRPKKEPLNAPKGMVIVGDTLFVADIDMIRGFDKKNGSSKAGYSLKGLGAIFLNGITVDGLGRLFVTDTATNNIYTLNPATGKSTVYLTSEAFDGPNGIALHGDDFYVTSWNNGGIYKVSGKRVSRVPLTSFNNLDGIVFDGDNNFYFADFTSGIVYRVLMSGTRDFNVDIIMRGLENPAGIGIDRRKNMLLIPQFGKGTALTMDIEIKME